MFPPTSSSSFSQATRRFVQVGRPACAARLMPNPSSSDPTLFKVGRVMRRKSQSSSSSSKHSDLTEENVEAHNRRTRNYHSNHTESSPERRSHASSSATSSTSFSTFIAKMRGGLGSCFNKRDNIMTTIAEGRSPSKEMMEKRKQMRNNAFLVKEKPLRERIPTAPAPATAPATTAPTPPDKVTNEKDSNEKVKEMEFMWANKYRPKDLEVFISNQDKAIELRALIREGGCGHIIFEGLPGVGKRTMIWAMLREFFGADRVQAREERKAFNLKGEMMGKIQVNVKRSPQHVEVNLSELKGYEKYVIFELVKETQNMISDKALPCGSNNCRDISKLEPITSLCTVVHLVPPSNKEIVHVLEFISNQDDIELPHQLAKRIAEKSKNNLHQAIRSFEASWKNNYPFKQDQVILTGWEDDIANIAKNIVEEQSPKQLYIIRGKLQNLMEHDVSPDFIFKRTDEGMFESEKPSMRRNVLQFPRIEEFIARFMSCYKSSIIDNIIVQHESTLHKGTSYLSLSQPNHL